MQKWNTKTKKNKKRKGYPRTRTVKGVICVMGIQEGEEREKGTEEILEAISNNDGDFPKINNRH